MQQALLLWHKLAQGRGHVVLAAVLLVPVPFGCGQSDGDQKADASGRWGGGTAGDGGSSSKGATAGHGGNSAGRVSGSAGRSSSAAGGSGNGAAGEAGACLVESEPHDLSDSCGLGPFGNGEYATVSTTCSFEATCTDLHCGEPWSDFDANGCRRAQCGSSTDCGGDERCVPRVLYEGGCNAGVYERCTGESCGQCFCSTSGDCNIVGFCQPSTDFPPTADCNVDLFDCDAVRVRLEYLDISVDAGFSGDALDSLEACAHRLRDARAECDGVAGTAGQAGAGGEAPREE